MVAGTQHIGLAAVCGNVLSCERIIGQSHGAKVEGRFRIVASGL
jgi:hypothetical protein